MGLLEIILIASGLAMAAFAVSISCGISDSKNTLKNAVKVGAAFGIFQAGMTFIGFLAGCSLRSYIEPVDHWIAFVLLSLIGGKMFKEAFDEESECIMLTSFKMLITLSIATSIDALAAGISISTLNTRITLPVILVGVITCLLSFSGVFIGKVIGCNNKFKKYIDAFGGVILIGIGIKILIEHLT